jgi:hypothetical protein
MTSLNYYLNYDIPAFQTWIYKCNCFTTIETQIIHELQQYILSSNTSTNTSKHTSRNKIIELLETAFTEYYNQTPQNTVQTWIDNITPYCFQGGYGYSIYYTNAPHHWCIKPDFYNDVIKLLDDKILIASLLTNSYLNIANKPATEIWCG